MEQVVEGSSPFAHPPTAKSLPTGWLFSYLSNTFLIEMISQPMPAKFTFFILLMLTVTACKPGPADPGNLTAPGTAAPVEIATSSSPTQTERPKPIAVPTGERGPVVFGLTYQGINGNRILEGIGGYPFQKPIDIPLPGKAIWLLATPVSDGIIWSAALEDGRVLSIHMLENGAIAGEPEVVSYPCRPTTCSHQRR